MVFYTLDSSNKILVKDGKVDNDVLESLVKEAFVEKKLTEDDYIRVRREEGGHMEVNYRELYDCFSSLDKEGKYHYANKEMDFNLGKAFVGEISDKIYLKNLKDFFESEANISVGDVEVVKKMKKVRKKKKETLSLAA